MASSTTPNSARPCRRGPPTPTRRRRAPAEPPERPRSRPSARQPQPSGDDRLGQQRTPAIGHGGERRADRVVANSLVMPMAATTPSSIADTTVVPVTTPASVSPGRPRRRAPSAALTTNGKATAPMASIHVTVIVRELDPLAADGGDHRAAPGAARPEYSCSPAVARRKASSSDSVCGDSSWSTAPTLGGQLADPLDRQAVDVHPVRGDRPQRPRRPGGRARRTRPAPACAPAPSGSSTARRRRGPGPARSAGRARSRPGRRRSARSPTAGGC